MGAIQRPHWEQTRQAMAAAPLVLVLHDTTELDFTALRALSGAGPIGDGNGSGFSAAQQPGRRAPTPAGTGPGLPAMAGAPAGARRRDDALKRKLRPRESDLWQEGFAAAGPAPEGCCWVDVADRGGDDYETMRAVRREGHHFLFRANQNRLVLVTAGADRQEYLLDYARWRCRPQGGDVVEIPGRGGRPARTAAVHLAAAAVWVPAPKGTPRRRRSRSWTPGWSASGSRSRRPAWPSRWSGCCVFGADGDRGAG